MTQMTLAERMCSRIYGAVDSDVVELLDSWLDAVGDDVSAMGLDDIVLAWFDYIGASLSVMNSLLATSDWL